jgi:hypothetical protein
MKKKIVYACILSLVAGIAAAEEAKGAWWKRGADAEGEQVAQQTPGTQGQQRPSRGGDRDRAGMMQRRRHQVSEEQREKIRAQFEEIRTLGEAARNEADPVKKKELVGQLRIKLTEGQQRMQAEFRKRIEKAEADLVKQRQRLDENEKNLPNRVEEQLQRILSGEGPQRGMGGKGPKGDGPRPGRKGPPPAEE